MNKKSKYAEKVETRRRLARKLKVNMNALPTLRKIEQLQKQGEWEGWEGQDRDNYTDDQDREFYTTD